MNFCTDQPSEAPSIVITSMLVRPATPDDVSAVLPMVAKICALHELWDASKYGFIPSIELRYERWLKAQATNERSVFLVAETVTTAPQQSTQLVAFIVGTVEPEIPIYRIQEFGFIHDLWVEPEYRHAGIARQMVMLTIEHFKQIGVNQIRLDTAVTNEAARNLFSKCGFRLSTMEMLIELSKE